MAKNIDQAGEHKKFPGKDKFHKTPLIDPKKKKKKIEIKEAYLGSFIEGGPGSNATYRKYYKGMI
jgi:hypothetical protein